MIRQLIAKVVGGAKALGRRRRPVGPQILRPAEHGVRRDGISACALRVTDTLQSHGYAAYIVGGAVRDLMLGRAPKDFDVATNATPDQVRPLFRRAIVIGRRFRLVHVLCGNEVVEVSTFRAGDSGEEKTDAHGRLLRDNIFGSQEQDAERRDFTVNALYFNPADETVVDYRGGAADLRARRLAIIGDPEQRFREDPVRMLRASRFAAKLGFQIDAATKAPIASLAPLLQNVPSSRLFDEILKLLLSGHALECVHELRRLGLHHGLLPLLDVILEQPLGERFVTLALTQTDARVREGKTVSPAFLFATLLWHEVLLSWRRRQDQGLPAIPALHEAIDEIVDAQTTKLAIQRRLTATMREIWVLQPRFDNRTGKRPYRLLENERFRAGFDFLKLRCEAGEAPAELAQWWQAFQDGDASGRLALISSEAAAAPERRRRRPRRRRPAADRPPQSNPSE
jgi:poly(A) polymerase